MPNWADNGLTVRGDDKTIKKFKTLGMAKDTDLSLNNLYPQPEELQEVRSPAQIVSDEEYEAERAKVDEERKTHPQFESGYPLTQKMSDEYKAKYGSDNWYDWRVKHWGTKWDIEASLISESPRQLIYSFMSAWSPPTDWLAKVATDYPTLSFHLEYEEGGVGYKGEMDCEGGEVVAEFCEDWTPEVDEEGEYLN